jgi:hypothetical protein
MRIFILRKELSCITTTISLPHSSFLLHSTQQDGDRFMVLLACFCFQLSPAGVMVAFPHVYITPFWGGRSRFESLAGQSFLVLDIIIMIVV